MVIGICTEPVLPMLMVKRSRRGACRLMTFQGTLEDRPFGAVIMSTCKDPKQPGVLRGWEIALADDRALGLVEQTTKDDREKLPSRANAMS
jgi:hypothetical protein